MHNQGQKEHTDCNEKRGKAYAKPEPSIGNKLLQTSKSNRLWLSLSTSRMPRNDKRKS